MKNNRMNVFTLLTVFLLSLSSCAVMKATNQPDKKDLSVLQTGTPRTRVIAELGSPVNSEVRSGHRKDVFSFVQGYSKTTKTLRAVGHGIADVYTLGLWEVAGTPIEGAASGQQIQVAVTYDKNERVSHVEPLKGNPFPQNNRHTRR